MVALSACHGLHMHFPQALTLVLLAAAGEGQLTDLLWDDVTCNSCGGLASQRCITTTTSQPQHSCAGGSPLFTSQWGPLNYN